MRRPACIQRASAIRTLAEIYDESSAQWQDAGSIPGDFMALLKDGTVLISGARDSAPGFRSTDTYDPTTGIIAPAGRMTKPAPPIVSLSA